MFVREISPTYEAIQFDGDFEKLKEFCPYVTKIDSIVYLPFIYSAYGIMDTQIDSGDYVIKFDDKVFEVLTKRTFNTKYKILFDKTEE